MKELIQKHVLNGEFESVYRLMSQTDFMEFEEAYISSAHEVESIMFYTCILDMMKTEETAEMHDLAFLLLVYPLNEVKSLLQMLLLHAVPEPVISDKKALEISRQILKLDPTNSVARNVLKETAKRLDNVVVDFNELNRFKNAH